MFQRILVPLDGSLRAEGALTVAARIARATGGSLLLLRVAVHPIAPPFEAFEPFGLSNAAYQKDFQLAACYLANKEQDADLRDLRVETQLMTGQPAQKILSCIEHQAIDLVVMSSRGETGFPRWMWGSVAQKVLRQSQVPVLVLHEASGILSNQPSAGQRPVHILVALDGSALAETTLEPAAMLATALSAPEQGVLHLVRVLPRPEQIKVEEAVKGALQQSLSSAQMRLQMIAEPLQQRLHLKVMTSVLVGSDAADILVRATEEGVPATEDAERRNTCDVIALATHGRGGMQRWVMGSTAERVLDESRLPLLVVHPAFPKQDPAEQKNVSSDMTIEA